jgi:nucleoside-diphosphate-sugar epimerase
MKVLIAGAGYVGAKALSLFSEGGHEVLGLRRSPVEAPGFFVADASTGAGLSELPQDFDCIIVAISPGARTDDAYRRAYPDGVRTLTRHFPGARVVLVSSTTVYEQEGGEEIFDDSPTSQDTFSAARILEAEQFILARDPTALVVRASGIYGPGRTATLARLAHFELEQPERALSTNRIHRDDLARALIFLAESKEARGVYLATDPHPATLGQIQDWLREVPHHEKLEVPRTEGRTRTRKSRRMFPRRLLDAGFAFNYPSFREGYQPILDALKGS